VLVSRSNDLKALGNFDIAIKKENTKAACSFDPVDVILASMPLQGCQAGQEQNC